MAVYTEDDISRIELLLRKVCFNIKQKGREILQDFNITPPQFDALQDLVYDGEMTVCEMSNNLYLAPSTITDLIDRMEKNELVERIRDTRDRRIVKVKAKEKAHILINEVITRRCRYIEDLLRETCSEDRKVLVKYLEILNNNGSRE